jgi:hypothetical protein
MATRTVTGTIYTANGSPAIRSNCTFALLDDFTDGIDAFLRGNVVGTTDNTGYFSVVLAVPSTGSVNYTVTLADGYTTTIALGTGASIDLVTIMGSTVIVPVVPVVPTGPAYYVATTGLDTNPGSLSLPFQTVQKGMSMLSAGTTLYLRGGTYHETVIESAVGTAAAPITITSYALETAIIDGTGLSPAHNGPYQNVDIQGSYVTFENITVANSDTRGMTVEPNAHFCTINNVIVHDTWSAGIWLNGDNGTIENSVVYNTNMSNSVNPGSNGSWAGGIVFGDSGHSSYGINTTISNNKIYYSWGEGLDGENTYGATIEGNRIWDNWAKNLYLDTVSSTTVSNNIVFYTGNTSYWRNSGPKPSDNISICDEDNLPGYPVSHDLKIYNNICINGYNEIIYNSGGAAGAAMINFYIGYNTCISTQNTYACWGMYFESPTSGDHYNTIIENNISVVTYSNANSGRNAHAAGVTLRNNNWNPAPQYTAIGSNDIDADPLLAAPLHAIANDQITTPLDPAWYKLTATSPGIAHAYAESWITTDFAGAARDASTPDIGAYEHA